MAQQAQTKDAQSAEHGETNEDLAKLNIDDDEENNKEEEDIKKSSSLSMGISKKSGMSGEQCDDVSDPNSQFQLLHESFTAELKKNRKLLTNNNNSCSNYK
jgi:hypothetical protein